MKGHLVLVAAFLLFIPPHLHPQEETSDLVSAEEYAVYSALLSEITQSPKDGKEVKLLVVNDRTRGPGRMCLPEEVAKWEKGIRADELKPLLDDLLAKNKKSTPLSRHFSLARRYVLLSVKDVADIFKGKEWRGWDDFYQKYPNSPGYISFSRVGFNTDATRAIVYRETSCDSLCGYGGYVLLNKESGHWKVERGYGCWQS